jgi:hypothetical protein
LEGTEAERFKNLLMLENLNFRFAQPEISGSAVCKGDSGGPVYTEVNGVVTLYGVTSGVVSHPKKGVAGCAWSFLQLVVPLQSLNGWITSAIDETLASK